MAPDPLAHPQEGFFLSTIPEQLLVSVIKKMDASQVVVAIRSNQYIGQLIWSHLRRGWRPRLNKSIAIDVSTDTVSILNLSTNAPAFTLDYLGFVWAAFEWDFFIPDSINIHFSRYEDPLVQKGKLCLMEALLRQKDFSVRELVIPLPNLYFLPLLHPKELVLQLITIYPPLSRDVLSSLDKLTMTGYNLDRRAVEQITTDILIHVEKCDIDFDDDHHVWHLVVPSYIAKLGDGQGVNTEGRIKLKGADLPFQEEYLKDVDHAFLQEWTHLSSEDDGQSWKRTTLCIIPRNSTERLVVGVIWNSKGDLEIQYKIFNSRTELEQAKAFCATFGNLEFPQMRDVVETIMDPFAKVDRMRTERLARQQRVRTPPPTVVEAANGQEAQ